MKNDLLKHTDILSIREGHLHPGGKYFKWMARSKLLGLAGYGAVKEIKAVSLEQIQLVGRS